MLSRIGLPLFAAVCLLTALPARAALQLEPGQWQETESGTENGTPVQPEVTISCVTEVEARDPVKALSALKEVGGLAGNRCKALNVHEADNTVSVDVECGEPSTLLVAVSMRFKFLDARHYTGTVKSTYVFKGKKSSAEKTIDAKWLGAVCKPQ